MLNFKYSALHLALGTSLAAGFAFNANAAEETSAKEVERIQVTGSRIKRTDLESAVPVTVISADDMIKQGFNNVQDALSNLSATTGTMNQQSIHGYTPAASSISLRNAGANRTLTLINGKRLNQYPKAAGGTDNFVDTANLPMEAVARIEVLNSGGSAIYGADAVGGVVNIILKKDFEGVAIKARHGDTANGGGAQSRVALSFGASSDKGNVSTFLEFSDSETLKATDRENFGLHTDKVPHSIYSSYSSYGARIAGLGGLDEAECTAGGFFFRPNGVCGFDRSKWRDLSPESQRVISTTTLNYELSDTVRYVGRIDISEAESSRDIEPMGIDAFDVNVNDGNVTMTSTKAPGRSATFDQATAFGGDFATAEDGDYYYVRRAWEFGPRADTTESRNFFFSAGLEGEFGDSITWDASWNYGRSRVDTYSYGYATGPGMFDYLTSGDNGISMFMPFTADVVESLAYTPFELSESSRNNFQFNMGGEAFELDSGFVAYAAGVEYSKQTYKSDSDSESKKNLILSTGGASGAGERDMWAIYTEFAIPVTDELMVNAALRYDDYSDFGGNFTPQLSAEYRPTDEWLIRGVIGKVFRAPDMHRVYGDPSLGFSQVIDYKACAAAGGTPGDGIERNPNVCNEHHIDITTGSNKDLDAETGYTSNLGFVYGGDAFNASVDIWKWKLDDMVSQIGAQKAAEKFDRYENMITRDANGVITHINAVAQNLAYQQVAGIDFNGTYTFDMNEYGELSLNAKGTYLLQSEGKTDPDAELDRDLDDTNLVRFRMSSSLTWQVNDYTATLFARYIDRHRGMSYRSHQTGTVAESDLEVASHTTWNLTGGYVVNANMEVKAGVVNLFDRGPNFDPTATGWPHYSRSLYNAVGREYFVEVEYNF